jgi:LysM repeat protein
LQSLLKQEISLQQTTIAVLPKESKYSIARKYGITVKELDRANPTIELKHSSWSKITIPGNGIYLKQLLLLQKIKKCQPRNGSCC